MKTWSLGPCLELIPCPSWLHKYFGFVSKFIQNERLISSRGCEFYITKLLLLLLFSGRFVWNTNPYVEKYKLFSGKELCMGFGCTFAMRGNTTHQSFHHGLNSVRVYMYAFKHVWMYVYRESKHKRIKNCVIYLSPEDEWRALNWRIIIYFPYELIEE